MATSPFNNHMPNMAKIGRLNYNSVAGGGDVYF
jgi:hypothetical protein